MRPYYETRSIGRQRPRRHGLGIAFSEHVRAAISLVDHPYTW
jgi:hypothetical protein